LLALRLRLQTGTDDPKHERSPEHRRIVRPDGSEIHIEFWGPPDGPPVVLTHGWGGTSTQWYYLRRRLADRYRLIAWDLPGMGLSSSPKNKDYSVGKFADDLRTVLDEAGGRPAILVGHSIGGMVTIEFCKRYPDDMANRVAGSVLIGTSPTNPLRMTPSRRFAVPLQKPLLEPLARATIFFSPLVWFVHLLGYLNGSQHRSNHDELFAGTESWGQLRFVTHFVPFVWPATYARGTLGMFRWDATDALPGIAVPTLVVAFSGDQMILPEAGETIRRGCPNARLVTLEPAGHMGLIERHEEFGEAVEVFLEECASSRSDESPTRRARARK